MQENNANVDIGIDYVDNDNQSTALRLSLEQIPEIKFTPENLARHLAADGIRDKQRWYPRGIIVTTRAKPKGCVGQVVYVEGVGYMVIASVTESINFAFSVDMSEFNNFCARYYEAEGFKNAAEFALELIRIYGDFRRHFYVHKLIKLRAVENLLPKRGAVIPEYQDKNCARKSAARIISEQNSA